MELGMTKEELEAHNEEIENYFVESAGYGRDKVRNFMDIVNKALQQKGERIAELEAQIEKMKCCGNCIHCKYDENEESYEFCEKHQQVVNVAIVPCSEWKGR